MKMSFEKLLAIFGGSFVVIIILTVIIMSLASGSKPNAKVVSQRHEQPFEPRPQEDIFAEQLRREKDASIRELAEQQSDAMKQVRAMQENQQRQNEAMMQRIEGMSSAMNAVEGRISTIEINRLAAKSVQIIKPERKTRSPQQESDAAPLQINPEHKLLSIVGKRAWIDTGEGEYSIAAGENPPLPSDVTITHAADNAPTAITSTIY